MAPRNPVCRLISEVRVSCSPTTWRAEAEVQREVLTAATRDFRGRQGKSQIGTALNECGSNESPIAAIRWNHAGGVSP